MRRLHSTTVHNTTATTTRTGINNKNNTKKGESLNQLPTLPLAPPLPRTQVLLCVRLWRGGGGKHTQTHTSVCASQE
jgi:hypothetical protein